MPATYKNIQITTIVGPQADKMINCIKRGESLTYIDRSVEGVPILEVYAEVDTGFGEWHWTRGFEYDILEEDSKAKSEKLEETIQRNV